MSDNRKRILEMLAGQKITVDEAERLLAVTETEPEKEEENTSYQTTPGRKQLPKYLRVVVEPGDNPGDGPPAEKVNIRVPMSLIRAGMKLTSLIPPHAADKMHDAMKEKGVDFDLRNIKPYDLDELIDALSDLEVNVDGGREKVRVYAE
jgi:hypothetical protein